MTFPGRADRGVDGRCAAIRLPSRVEKVGAGAALVAIRDIVEDVYAVPAVRLYLSLSDSP